MTRRRLIRIAIAVLPLILAAGTAFAQSVTLDFGGDTNTGRIVQLLILMTVLSLAPSLLVMVTSFTRIVVVLSFLRTAIGIQQTPPNAVIISLALFLTGFTMAPTFEVAWRDGLQPLIENRITETEGFERTTRPLHAFMMRHTREADLRMFFEMGRIPAVETAEQTPLRVLVPAFMISELRRAFEIGFLLFIPFLIIDMVIAAVLMAMGMMMLPPIVVSLPFKLIFFVLVDGWQLVAGSLVQSFGVG